jgi:colicin import membrane protein
MQAETLVRHEFAPPPPKGIGLSMALALLVHGLLAVALSFSVQWKREAENVAVEAELWSAIPMEAAPPEVAEPPPPAPMPVQEDPRPVAKPLAEPAPTPDDSIKEAQIVLEKEKKRKELEKLKREEEDRKRQKELKEKIERDRLEKAEKAAAEKKKLEQQKETERKKQESADAERRKAAETDARKKKEAEAAEAKRLDAQRAENLKRMAGMAGANGSNTGGSATQSSGQSASYSGRVKARVKPNIVFTDDVSGNPVAEVEVRTAPDGTIVGRKLTKPSGVQSWDDAVLKAIDKTEVLPKDIDGRIPSSLILVFRPKD